MSTLPCLHPNINPLDVTPSSYIMKLYGIDVHNLNLTPSCQVWLPYIITFDMKTNHQRYHTIWSQALHCLHCTFSHYGNVDFVHIHNDTCYNDFLLSRIHVNNTYLLTITCTLVSAREIIRSLECSTQ